jgi:hypothetical protein
MWTLVTTAQLDTESGRRIAPFAAGVVLPIARRRRRFALRRKCIRRLLVRRDVHAGHRPSPPGLGSADQPPLAPALAALMDTIAPGSLVALRLPTVLATTGAVVVAGLADRTTGVVGSNLATDSHVDRVLKSGPGCYSLW